jgi:hypothetical protein
MADPEEDFQNLKRHVDKCPIGWHQGKLIRTRSTVDQDVINWISKLQVLVDQLVCEHDWEEWENVGFILQRNCKKCEKAENA